MKTILLRTFYGYTITLLLFLCPASGYGQKQSTSNDPYKQALSRYISGMTGVGCDTVLAKQLLQALREPATTKNKITIPAGTKSRVPIPAILQDGLSTATATTTNTVGWNQAGNYLNLPDSYQWYVSPGGNDNNPGTLQAPFQSIQRAIDMASNGDAIKIADGNYGCFYLSGKNIYLVGNVACPHSVTIDGSDSSGAYLTGCSPELHGMTFINCYNAVYIDNAFPFLSHLVMTQNFGATMYSGGQNYIYTLCNSLLYDNNAGSDPVIVHNPINSGFSDICNVTITDNQGASALSVKWVTGHSDVYIMNSILYNPGISAEMSVSYIGGSSATVTYSNISGKNYLPQDMIYFGDGVIDVDPLFDLQDFIRRYQLADNSPCIDAGYPDYYDCCFPPSKGGSRSDMGAYGYESRMTGSCQAPVEGDDFESAIDIGSFHNNFQHTDTRVPADYKNDFPWVDGVDVFYRFTIDRAMDIQLSHCSSSVYDSYVALLNQAGGILYSNDDSQGAGGCPSPKHARLLIENLPAGTYWVLSKMTQDDDGYLTTIIEGSAWGNDMEHPINAGERSRAFQYVNTQNTGYFTNSYTGRPTNDIFYKFSISQKMDITVSHCGSGLDNTYMYLLDANGDVIAYNDDYAGEDMCSSPLHACIKRTLNAGTYYVVSEGESQEGSIKTYIQGSLPAYTDDLGYPGNPPVTGNNTGDNSAVGITSGAFDVSATGAATYSIPITVPPGINGLQPSLAIVYNSQSGNGVAGWGCSLAGISAITRVPKSKYYDNTARGMTYLADDGYALDGQRLVLSSRTAGQDGAIYHTEADPFTKITVHGSADNTWFEVITKDGMKYYYGGVSNSDGRHIYYDTSNPSNTVTKVNAWYLDYVEDPSGNYMNYYYSRYEHFTYLASVIYGKNKYINSSFSNMVSMSYQSRTDQTPFIFDGIQGKMQHRLEKITGRTGNDTFREYVLEYANTDHFSRLVSVTEKNSEGEALKPVTLNWGYYGTSNSHTASPLTLEGSLTDLDKQYYTTADLNGDGVSDIISLTPNYGIPSSNGGTEYKTLSQHFIAVRQDNGSYKHIASSPKYLPLSMDIDKINHRQGLGAQMAFNALGDGKQYLLAPFYLSHPGNQVIFFVYGLNSPAVPPQPDTRYPVTLQQSSELPFYTIGNVHNNGKDAVVFIEKGHSNNVYPGRIGQLISIDNPVPLYTWENINFSLPSQPEKMFLDDFNGDGMNDLLIFYEGGYTVYFNKGGTGICFDNTKKKTGSNISDCSMIRTGDFNGDGLPDFILNAQNDDQWYFALNNGNGTFTKLPAGTIDLYDQDIPLDDNYFDCIVTDIDFDGKSDVVIVKGMFTSVFNFNKTHTRWFRSIGTELHPVKSVTSNNSYDAESRFYISGDFNGDGRPEIANYGYNCFYGNTDRQWRTYRRNGLQLHSGLLTSVTDGMGNQTSIEYGTLTDTSLYTKNTDGAFPVTDIQPALMAVKTVTTPDGIGGTGQTSYTYGGLKAHLQGKGLLGISRTTATSHLTGVTVESGVSTWNDTWHAPAATYQKTTAGDKTSLSTNTFSFVPKGLRHYFAYPATQVNTDSDGNTVTTTRQYDGNGNITVENTTYGTDGYQETQYSGYVQTGASNQYNRPQTVTVTRKHADDNREFIARTEYLYNGSTGMVTQRTDNAHAAAAKQVVTAYGYDTWGNLVSEAVSAAGQTTFTRRFEYDPTKRFVGREYSVPASSVASYTYDTWGNLVTETDETNSANSYTTTHTYDAWGRRMATVTHDGQRQVFTTGWGSTREKKYYTLVQGNGIPWVKTWYDALGRETEVQTVGPKEMLVKTNNYYNNKGQLWRSEQTNGSLSSWTEYEYDPRGRITVERNKNGQNTGYTYTGKSGNIAGSVTTTVNGKEYTKAYDSWGNTRTSSDPAGGAVEYFYSSAGMPDSIRSVGADFTMSYDEVGNQLTLKDPNAGVTSYRYDASGRIIRQEDARGNVQTTVYDALGRVESTTMNGETTSYEYVTSGDGIYQLQKVQQGSNYTTYTYDSRGRVTGEIRMAEGEQLVFSYTYDGYGRLATVGYPGGVTVSSSYDAYGNLVKVKAGSATVWELAGMTGGQTASQLGGTMTSTATYDANGLLSQLKTVKGGSTIRLLDYQFSASTGNLSSRTGMAPLPETFEYDHTSGRRLHKVLQNGTEKMRIDYAPNGNISFKTEVGTYSYGEDAGPHALTGVENTAGDISTGQSVGWNAFQKATNVKDTVITNNIAQPCELDIIYGPDQQRWKTIQKKNNAVTKTVIFAGDYEKITENGITKQLYYISGGDGLAAIYVKQSGQSDQLYYAHTDHLGSIIRLTDNNGSSVFDASYDAWGKQEISNSTFTFHRGYTGHEHLPEFGLINMNGRMYDPLVGRFLSPDPFVQAPEYSQSFNRYSYCLNNPLIYTDPSGEFFWLIATAAAYTLFFTDVGYDIQKFISPIAVKFEVHPFASDERFFGAKTSVGIPQISSVAYRWEWSANYYTRFYDTGWKGWETTKGEEFSLLNGLYSASYTDYTMHGMEDFNQTVLRLKWGGPGLNASYYNDYIHHDKFKFFRKLTPNRIITKGDDKQDRWRTAATHIQVGPLSWGMKVITGDPGPDGYRETYEDENGQKYYKSWGDYDPGKYSHGIQYFGIGPLRIGHNSEGDRNHFQNKIGHKPNNIPFFPKVPRKPRWYWFW